MLAPLQVTAEAQRLTTEGWASCWAARCLEEGLRLSPEGSDLAEGSAGPRGAPLASTHPGPLQVRGCYGNPLRSGKSETLQEPVC